MADHEVSDEQLRNYIFKAKETINAGAAADPLALELLIQVCEVLLAERHPKPLFENLWYQGVDDEREIG
jgi:hypothetical protein